jgi:hypothetical protein
VEESQKYGKVLKDCAELSKTIHDNPYLKTGQVTLMVDGVNFAEILLEIEEFVRIKVDKLQNKISIDIGDIEFIFIRN